MAFKLFYGLSQSGRREWAAFNWRDKHKHFCSSVNIPYQFNITSVNWIDWPFETTRKNKARNSRGRQILDQIMSSYFIALICRWLQSPVWCVEGQQAKQKHFSRRWMMNAGHLNEISYLPRVLIQFDVVSLESWTFRLLVWITCIDEFFQCYWFFRPLIETKLL